MVQITPWERATLELLAGGATASQLAQHLQVSEPEVERKLASLFAKMGAACQSDAVAAASRRGLLRA